MLRKGLTSNVMLFLGILITIIFFLALMFIYFNEEIISSAEKISDILKVI